MKKPKKKLTVAQRRARRERKKNFEMVFFHGKQEWIRREPTIDGMPVDEFVARNADPVWLHQHELWELMDAHDERSAQEREGSEPM
jgi:hypothetical protein